jgi:hypothetical protein
MYTFDYYTFGVVCQRSRQPGWAVPGTSPLNDQAGCSAAGLGLQTAVEKLGEPPSLSEDARGKLNDLIAGTDLQTFYGPIKFARRARCWSTSRADRSRRSRRQTRQRRRSSVRWPAGLNTARRQCGGRAGCADRQPTGRGFAPRGHKVFVDRAHASGHGRMSLPRCSAQIRKPCLGCAATHAAPPVISSRNSPRFRFPYRARRPMRRRRRRPLTIN